LTAAGCSQQCSLALEEATIELLSDMVGERIASQARREMQGRAAPAAMKRSGIAAGELGHWIGIIIKVN